MGMFDWVRCEYPLPGLDDPKAIRFQTKDMDDMMYLTEFVITKDGRLVHHKVTKVEDRSDPKAEGLMRSLGCATPVEWVDVDLNYHGTLNFYGDKNTGELRAINLKNGIDRLHPEETEWFEYNAKFTDGQLVSVERYVEAE